MEHFSHFAPLAERYSGFVLDLWGVIHDGVNAFPHAVETLTQLRAAGKRTLLLSNVTNLGTIEIQTGGTLRTADSPSNTARIAFNLVR